ncbi:hypothetical protein LOTGIDRAFT_157980 [Lottia gigantea]|uniref:DUF885 domain-containing protein n=1 Tax=Lottia gigantea TaxID=225164 RepID=V4CF96_LOTGI|nr:hypothetical protein LOTGIDRAFT_157980 [Lottia gigantea]ESP00690.1 hypothetical protein LOTGIDRAFT_157980 [Lottia gigantea]
MALTLHETVPGHHLQGAYQLESSLPKFLKNADYDAYYSVPYHFPFYTSYVEGWGLYAESLGEDMNVYKTHLDLFGRYGFEIFRACRLVVDTGLHYFKWTRQQAIQYMVDHNTISLAEIELEIDRYITWPGQACAYKIGELKIRELREKAKAALGDKFDIKEFHSMILTSGPMPLNVLETIINDWITDHRQTLIGK